MSGINENVAKATLLEQNLDEKINLATSWRAPNRAQKNTKHTKTKNL